MRLSIERLEARDQPAAVAFDGTANTIGITLDPGPHTVSVDRFDDRSTVVSIDGVQAALALTAPEGLPPLAVVVDGTATSRLVAQNNTAQPVGFAGGAGDDTLFGGRGFSFFFGGAGADTLYAILGPSQIVAGGDLAADAVFVRPDGQVTGDPFDTVATFFRPDALPGAGLLRQEPDGQLTVLPADAGSVVELAGTGGEVTAAFDLGDGNGPQTRQFSGVTSVSYFGGAGRDVFIDRTDRPSAGYGGAGDDYLFAQRRGPAGPKLLKGLGGADQVLADTDARTDLSGNGGADTVVQFGGGPTVFRVGLDDAAVAGFVAGRDAALSP